LNWGRNLVVGKFDVLDEMVIEGRVGELEDWLWNIVSRSLNWDIIVLLEVDTGLLLGWIVCNTEKFALNTWVGWAWDVFAITPLPISRTTSRCVWGSASTTTGSRVAISVLVEGRSNVIPSSSSRRSVTARLEIGSVGVGPSVSTRTSVETVAVEEICQYKSWQTRKMNMKR
jgi:hypothetical protein